MMSRRKFIKLGALALGGTALGVTAARAAHKGLRLSHHRVPFPVDRPIRVAHLTDLHLGWTTPQHVVDRAHELVIEMKPDLVVLTGDYVNASKKHLAAVTAFVKRLPDCPRIATLGNHDHWSGPNEVTEALVAGGALVLSNEHITLLDGLTVVGVDDGRTKRDDVDRAFSGVAHPERALVLCHFPPTAAAVADQGGRLILSGHTHGGQIAVPKITPAMGRAVGIKHLVGWHDVGDARLFVNAGMGHSRRGLRAGTAAAAEVALIELLPV